MSTSPENPPPPQRRAWRESAAAAKAAAKPSKGRRLFQGLAFFLALTALFVALIWIFVNPAHTPYYVPLNITEHTNLYVPVIAQARQDWDAMRQGKYFPQGTTNLYTSQERQRIDEELTKLKSLPPREPLLFYLSGPVLCNAQGELFLLPGDAEIDSQTAWLRLRDILEAVQACPSKQKLLVLDVMQPLANPRLGILANDTAERVKALVEEMKNDLNYWVLCACSPGQTALASEELRRSAFNYYFEEGLKGGADGTLDGKQDGRVTVKELVHFVEARVGAWAAHNRNAQQTPKALKSAEDFELVRLPRGEAPKLENLKEAASEVAKLKDAAKAAKEKAKQEKAAAGDKGKDKAASAEKTKGEAAPADKGKGESASAAKEKTEAKGEGKDDGKGEAASADKPRSEPLTYPVWLAQGWQQCDKWVQDRTFSLAPVLFRQLEAELLSAEEQWRGGEQPERIEKKLTQKLKVWTAQAAKLRAALPRPEEARSLALAVALGRIPNPDLDTAANDLVTKLNQLQSAPRAKPGDDTPDPQTKLANDFLAKFLDEKTKDLKDVSGFDLSRAVFRAAVADPNLDRVHLQFLHGLLARHQLESRYVETLFLHRLWKMAAGLDKDSFTWPADTVRRAVRVVDLGERASALACGSDPIWEPRAFPWVQALLEAAAQERHDGEVQLLAYGYASPRKADAILQKAEEDYKHVDAYLEVLHDVLAAYDESMSKLPGYAAYYAEHEILDREAWDNSLVSLQELHRLLSAAPAEGGSDANPGQLASKIDELRQQKDNLRQTLGRLTRPFTQDLALLINRVKSPNARADQYLEAQSALQICWLPAAGRVELWTAMHNLGEELQEQTALEDQKGGRRTATALEPDNAKAIKEEHDRAARRARVMLDLFRLGGVPDVDGWQKKLTLAWERRDKPSAWPTLAHELREAWAALPKAVPEPGAPLAQAWTQDRCTRIYYPLDAPERLTLEPDNSPSLALHKEPALAYWRWLGGRYQYESQDLHAVDTTREAGDFYAGAADRYLEDVRAGERLRQLFARFEVSSATQRPDLREDRHAADYELQLRIEPAAKVQEIRELSADDDWLSVEVPTPPDGAAKVIALKTLIKLKPEWERTQTPPPAGFLLEALINGRSFHHRVAVDTPPGSGQRLQLLLSEGPEPRESSLSELRLRPNVQQEIFVFVRNPVDRERKVFVELQTADQIVKSPLLPLGKGVHKISFPAGAPPPKPDAPLPLLRSPLIQLRLVEQLSDKESMPLDKKPLKIVIQQPSEYVRVKPPKYTPGEKNRLSVIASATSLRGAPCPVELVVSPALIPGLRRVAGTSNLRDKLRGPDVELFAENLEFDDRDDRHNGEVSVTIDGCERAYVYSVTFSAEGAAARPVEVNRPSLHLPTPLMARPSVSYLLPLQVFSPEQDLQIEVGVDRTNRGTYVALPDSPFRGTREQHIGFSASGPNNGLFFETAVKSWSIPIDTSGLQGPCGVQVRLLDSQGAPLASVAPLKATLTVDGTPPDKDLRIVSVNKTPVPPGAASVTVPRAPFLTLTASGDDEESGVKEVFFFQGGPVDNHRPKDAIPEAARQLDDKHDKNTPWEAKLPLALDTRAALQVTAEFVNGVGLSSFKTIRVELADPAAAPAAQAKGSIGGIVNEGNRVLVGQDVKLADAKGNHVKTVKSDDSGKFTFADLAPGNYLVSAQHGDRSDEKSAEVSAGQESSVELNLLLRQQKGK